MSSKTSERLQLAFHPKTYSTYASMFKTFVAFCIYTKACITNTNVKVVLLFLECCQFLFILHGGKLCVSLDGQLMLYDLPFHVLDHPKVKFFLKALKLKRHLNVKSHNIITISWLFEISKVCEVFTSGVVCRAFWGLFGFSKAVEFWPLMRLQILMAQIFP